MNYGILIYIYIYLFSIFCIFCMYILCVLFKHIFYRYTSDAVQFAYTIQFSSTFQFNLTTQFNSTIKINSTIQFNAPHRDDSLRGSATSRLVLQHRLTIPITVSSNRFAQPSPSLSLSLYIYRQYHGTCIYNIYKIYQIYKSYKI